MGSTYANEGAGFVTDYSNLAGAGSAFDSFAKAFQNAQDQKVKNQEVQARIAAMQTQQQRDATDQAIKLKASGLQQEPTGELTDAPATARSKGQTIMEGAKSGFTPQFDENNEVTGTKADPNSMAYMKAMAQANASSLRGKASMDRNDISRDAQSSAAVKHIHDDKVLVPMRGQAANIDKGLETLNGSADHKPSWLEINEVAQDYASALGGAKGSSDFKLKQSEQESFDKAWGDIKGHVGSDPDQPADQSYVDFYKKFGGRLKDVYDKQMSARAQNLLVGSQKAYKHNPDAYEAMKEAADLYKDGSWRGSADVQSTAPQAPQQQAPPPQGGLVPKQQGMLGTTMGLLGFGPKAQAAAPTPAPHPQDAAAIATAQKILSNKNASPEQVAQAKMVLKVNGQN